jgi:hypothetical protein
MEIPFIGLAGAQRLISHSPRRMLTIAPSQTVNVDENQGVTRCNAK